MLEHPKSSKMWNMPELRALAAMPGVFGVEFDQCMYGLKSVDEFGEGPCRKPTRILTNIPGAEVELSRRCSCDHTHVQLINGRAKKAEEYPEELCRALVRCARKVM